MNLKLGKIAAAFAVAGLVMTGAATAASASETRASIDWEIRGTFGTGADCQAFGPRYNPKQWWCEEHVRRGYWILWVEA